MSFLPVLVALDVNRDGEISATEIDNAAKALKTLDKNKDPASDKNNFLID